MSRVLWLIMLGQLTFVGLIALALAHFFGRSLGVPGSIILALILELAIHPGTIAIDYALALAVRPPIAPEQRLTWTQALRTFDREIDASMRGVWWANPFRAGFATPSACAPLQPQVILCVHGYFCTRAVWAPFMHEAARRGFHTAALNLEPPFGSIEGYRQPLHDALEALARAHPEARLVVVAHSMGALAVRDYLASTPAHRVTQLFTLGAPHHGTLLANFGRSTNTRQMRLDSLWLERLAAREEASERPPVCSILSVHDNIVIPYDSAILEGAENVVLSGIGHVSLLYDRSVWDAIFTRLASSSAGVS